MPSLTTLAALTALFTTAFAVPTPDTEPNVNVNAVPFRINQVSRGKVLKNGPAQVAKTYAKFGKTIPANVDSAAKAQSSGTVVATPEEYDTEYLCPVQIGTPAQTLMMDFDTGSSDTWVYSSLLSAGQRNGHDFYTPSKSSTSQLSSGQSWQISYGDGSGARGTVYADTVAIGAVTVTRQAVEAATSLSASFLSDTNNDGLVGLAWPKINNCYPKQCNTFVQNAKPSLPGKVFTADLKKGAPGSFDFGFINATKYTGDITYAKVTKAMGFWQFSVSGYKVGSTPYSFSLNSIADTGTTLIYLNDNVVANYYAQVSGAVDSNSAGGYVFPCTATLPDLGITINGVTYTVPGNYLNYAPNDDGTCFGGLQSSAGFGINILGDVFLKAVFAVFDVANVRIGFATKNL